MPPYIYIGRDIDTSDTEKQFINDYIGPGFYGPRHAPFMIPDPLAGPSTLSAAAGLTVERLDRRLKYLHSLTAQSPGGLARAPKIEEYLQTIDAARAMMDSPVKTAFDYQKQETPETIAAYEPRIAAEELLDKRYYFGRASAMVYC